jgi:hypothetical protein
MLRAAGNMLAHVRASPLAHIFAVGRAGPAEALVKGTRQENLAADQAAATAQTRLPSKKPGVCSDF